MAETNLRSKKEHSVLKAIAELYSAMQEFISQQGVETFDVSEDEFDRIYEQVKGGARA